MYSKVIIEKESIQKLILLLISLEKFLSGYSQGSIQQTLGDRLAFALEVNFQPRKDIVELVKKCYEIRSKYIHNGQTNFDLEVVNDLFRNVFLLFHGIVKQSHNFPTKESFVQAIDNIKYAAIMKESE